MCVYIYRNCSQRHVWHCYFWCSLAARGFLPPTYWYHMVGKSTSYSPSPLCSRLKSTGLSQFGRKRRKKKKREKPSYRFSSRALPVPLEMWVPSSSKGTCAYVLAIKRSHGRAFTVLYLFCWVLAQVNHDTLKRGGLDLEMDHVVSIIGDHRLKSSLAKTDQSLSLSDSFAQSQMNLETSGRRVFLVNADNAEVRVA